MNANRATEYLLRCYGVYRDISCGDCPYRKYEKEDRGCIYALHEDADSLLEEQRQRIENLEQKIANLQKAEQPGDLEPAIRLFED